MAVAARLGKLAPWAPAAIVVAFALVIAWAFAATTLSLTGSMGLPLDDSYLYLTYAKQLGGGSAGATSPLWATLLAPFWLFGARGQALVWVSFGWCAVLYALVGVGIYRFVRIVRGDHAGGLAAAVMALAVAPFAWSALAGMEVALTAALLVGTLLLLANASREGRPAWLLLVCLSATSLSRPEAMLIVVGIVAASVVMRLRRRAWREAAWWLLPLAAPLAAMTTNQIVAGQALPGSFMSNSHFTLPGFDWTYWWMTVKAQSADLLGVLFADATSPLVWPTLVLALYAVGVVRVGLWARRERRWLVGVLVVVVPVAMMLAVIASTAQWRIHNFRHIAPALPLLFVPVGVALVPIASPWARRPAIRRAMQTVAIALAVLFVRAARTQLVADMKLFAQGAMDTSSQVVTLGHYLRTKLPDAFVMLHEPGAIAYFFDGKVHDLSGQVTSDQAGVAHHGPGARFEFLESLPPERRPTHFAISPRWLGTTVFFGNAVKHTVLRRAIEPRRFVTDGDMQVIASNWDHAGTAERPMNDHTGWAIVDRVDVAHLASEQAHDWAGRMGRRAFGDPPARWSFVERSTAGGLHIDGGRTIRDGGERFRVRLDPARPTRVVIRTGGQNSYLGHEPIHAPVTLTLFAANKRLGTLTIAPPAGAFSELTFTIPPHTFKAPAGELRTQASGSYRVFHWFVLQPE